MTNSIWVNSNYSLLASSIKLADYVRKCSESGEKWAGLTDINTTTAIFKFCILCDLQKLKPIIGVELDTQELHLLLFARNNNGLARIFQIVGNINWDNKDQQHRGSLHNLGLFKENKDIIMFSLSRHVDTESKKKLSAAFKHCFFNNYIPGESKKSFNRVNSINSSITTDILRVARNGEKGTISFQNYDAQRNTEAKVLNTSDVFYNKNFNMTLFLQNININIHKLLTHRTADQSSREKANERLKLLAVKGLVHRQKTRQISDVSSYKSQLHHELTVISECNMANYILVVHDYCKFMQQNSILVGPGRGSATGSLVCYVLYITHIDPIKVGLSFERFLCSEQKKLPDIDVDIQSNRRVEVFDYIFSKYDNFQAAHICTVAKLNSKNALKLIVSTIKPVELPIDVNAIVEKLYSVENIGNYRWTGGQASCPTSKVFISPLYKNLIRKDRPFHKFWQFITTILPVIDGIKKNKSIHAAGLIITPNNNLQAQIGATRTVQNRIVTQFTMDDIASLGFPKYDLLSLNTLTIISNCLHRIYQNSNKIIHIYQLINDKQDIVNHVMSCLATNSTFGIFQLESTDMKKLVHEFRPKSISELALVISLYRPGVAKIRQVLLDKRAAQANANINYDNITKDSYGFLIYQEQISMLFARDFNLSNAKAEALRRKLQLKTLSHSAKKAEFMQIAVNNGITINKAESIFKIVARFGDYAYNKSHATAYAVICYWTAYLKYRYPFEYGCTLAKFFGYDSQKVTKIINMFQKNGFKIRTATPYISKSVFIKQGDNIYLPWDELKLDKNAILTLSALQKPLKLSIIDFFRAIWHNVDQQQSLLLINDGCLDCFGYQRKTLINNLFKIYSWCRLLKNNSKFPI